MIYESPRISTIIFLALGGVALIPLSVGLISQGYQELTPWVLLAISAGLVGAILVFYAIFLTIWIIGRAKYDLQERANEIASKTPRLLELEIIRTLTPEQLAVITKLEHRAHIVGHTTRSKEGWDITYFLSTPGGDVPIMFVEEFFRSSPALTLTPIRRYTEGSINYQYARALTEWARENGLATGGEGPLSGKAAEWISPAARAEVFNLFEIDTSPK